MTNQDGSNIATNEAMMLGIDRTINKTAPFLNHLLTKLAIIMIINN